MRSAYAAALGRLLSAAVRAIGMGAGRRSRAELSYPLTIFPGRAVVAAPWAKTGWPLTRT